jgi:hypothetical protein
MKKSLMIAVLGLCVPAAARAAEPLGRLFFTPAQRNTLDAGKHTVAQAPVKPGPQTVRLNGVVTRSDAERTIWINGTAYYNAAPDGVQVKTNPGTPESTSIRMQGKAGGARVKVGQQLELNSGHVEEGFSRRQTEADTTVAPADNSTPRAVAAKKPRASDDEDTPAPVREKNPAKIEGSRGGNGTEEAVPR